MKSRRAGPERSDGLSEWLGCKSPGPLGKNDHADIATWFHSKICGLLGDSPGPLGVNDHAQPKSGAAKAVPHKSAPKGVPAVLSDVYKAKQNDCSGFLKAVAKAINLPAGLVPEKQADPIIDDIITDKSLGWVSLGKGVETAQKAIDAAGKGYLVVAALQKRGHLQFKKNPKTGKYDIPHEYKHGHVAVVLPSIGKNGYPNLISGSIGEDGKSDGSKGVWGVWRGVDAPNVGYYQSPEVVPILRDAYSASLSGTSSPNTVAAPPPLVPSK